MVCGEAPRSTPDELAPVPGGLRHAFLRRPGGLSTLFDELGIWEMRAYKSRWASWRFLMPRLPVTGSSIASPLRDEGELKRVLSDLRVHQALSPTAVHELYLNLAAIIGQWMLEQQRLEVSSVAGSLLSTARSLNELP